MVVEAVDGEVKDGPALVPLREYMRASYLEGRALLRPAKEVDCVGLFARLLPQDGDEGGTLYVD